jgi:Tfp pilus assembly protein PilW
MKNSFTLIEFLIYIAIVSSILVLISGFFWNIFFGGIKETAYQEVQQNGQFALTKITQEIKKATGINSPSPGNSANSLSLAMANPNLNPTVFDLANGKLRITQGANPPIELTSNQVIVSNLQFSNLSYEGTPGVIRIEMTVYYFNPANRMEYQASIDLKSTVSLFPGGASP